MVRFYSIRKTIFLFLAFILLSNGSQVQAQWVSCHAPLGGDVTCIDTFGSYLWAALQDGGVYRSPDNGANWEEVNNGLHTNYYSGVQALMHIPGKMFAATQNGLFATTDFGLHWDSVALSQTVYSLTQQGAYLYATEYGNVWRSSDNGVTWNPLTIGLPTPFTYTPYQLVSVQGKLILRTIGFGMYSSADNGDTWTAYANPSGVSSTDLPTFLRVVGNRLFINFYDVGILYSDDAGATWNNAIAGTGAFTYASDITMNNGSFVVASTTGIWVHPLSGGTWTQTNQNLTTPYPAMNNIFKTAGSLYIGAADGVIGVDSMITNYQILRNGMPGTNVYFLTGYNGRVLSNIYRQTRSWSSVDQGNSWTVDSVTNYYLSEFTASAINNSKWYLSLGGGVDISTDGGQNWNYVYNTGLPRTYFSVTGTPSGDVFMGSDSGKIYKVVNDALIALLTQAFTDDDWVTLMSQAGTYVYAATGGGITTPHLYRSANNGQTWQIVSTNWSLSSELTDGLAYQDNRLIAFTDGYGAFVSTNFGDTWSPLNNGLPPNAAYKNVKVLNNKVYAVASNYEQLYSLASGDTTWVCENCAVGDPIRAASVWATDSVLFMGTANKGIWKRTLPQTNAVANVSTKTITATCFPNPGNTITVQLDGSDIQYPVGINIRSVDGKLCEHTSTSNSKALLDLPKLIPGLYFIELTDNAGRHTFIKWTKR